MKNKKEFWSGKSNSLHAVQDDYWFDRYAEEFLYFKGKNKVVVDAGCGSGEILVRVAEHFQKIYAVDFSASMLEKAKTLLSEKGISNVECICADIVTLNQVIPEKADMIYNLHVMQHLSPEQIDQFLENCKSILKPGGQLVLMHIPEFNSRALFITGFFKENGRIPFSWVILNYLRSSFYLFRKKIIHPSFRYDASMDNWFSITDFEKLAKKNGYRMELYSTLIPFYRYRFHVRLTPV